MKKLTTENINFDIKFPSPFKDETLNESLLRQSWELSDWIRIQRLLETKDVKEMNMEETEEKCPHCGSNLVFHMNNYFCSNDNCDWFDDCECLICKKKQHEAGYE